MKLRFIVLARRHLEFFAPVALKPVAAKDETAIKVVLGRKIFFVSGKKPPGARLMYPAPGWPRYRNADRLHVSRRNVDDEAGDLSVCDRFEMFGNAVNVPVPDKVSGWLDCRPCLPDVFSQTTLGQFLVNFLKARKWLGLVCFL